jgi:hypothetical protein
MGAGSWLADIGHAVRLFVESIPYAIWLAYSWAKEWQGLLGGMLLVVAAWIFTQGSLRTARIRAATIARSAEIAARGPPIAASAPAVAQPKPEPKTRTEPPQPLSLESELIRKVEQLRSLIRSAMSTLTSDSGTLQAAPNFYCERISLMRFDDEDTITALPEAARDPYKRLTLQLAVVRYATEKRSPQAELSQALVQLNTRARELSSVLSPPTSPAEDTAIPARTKIQDIQ